MPEDHGIFCDVEAAFDQYAASIYTLVLRAPRVWPLLQADLVCKLYINSSDCSHNVTAHDYLIIVILCVLQFDRYPWIAEQPPRKCR